MNTLMRKQLFIRPAVVTALLLSIPLIMNVVDRHQPRGQGWHWSFLDFAVMAALLMAAGTAYQLVAARTRDTAKRIGLGALIAGVAVAIWIELAVGGISQLLSWGIRTLQALS